jgi:hypothetical protein
MKTELSTTETSALAATVAPEDLKCGDFVAVLNELVELPSFFWFDTPPGSRDELVRIRYIPSESGMPWKIKAVCLPFVFVESPFGQSETLDIRRVQLVRLQAAYAKRVRKDLRKQRPQLRGQA